MFKRIYKNNGVMKNFSTGCPHYPKCPSCRYGKPPAFKELCNESVQLEKNLEIPLIFGKVTQWRMKAKLAVRRQKGKNCIGLFAEGTHWIQEIPHCIAHHQSINAGVEVILNSMNRRKIQAYSESGKGFLRYLQMHVCSETEKVQLTLVVNRKELQERVWIESLSQHPLWHSVWINFHTEKNNAIFSSNWQLYSGNNFLKQKIGKYYFAFHPASFSQANLNLYEKIIQDIQVHIPKGSKVCELFAGVGSIGIHAAALAESVTLVEENPFSYHSFNESRKFWPNDVQRKVSYESIKAEDVIFREFEVVILDPPRKGVDQKLLQKLLTERKLQKIIYLSCNHKTFLKDSLFIVQNGFYTKKIQSYLFFPGSNHIEVLGVFEKKSG